MLVEGNEELNKTLTVINKKSQYPDDYFDDVFDDSKSETDWLDEYKYKEDDRFSDSRTESVKSENTEVL